MRGLLARLRQSVRPRWVALSCAPALVWLMVDGRGLAGLGGPPATVTISMVGTADLHGQIHPANARGGLALLGGYLANLRAARHADGGAVLLFDSGDTYLDGIESNLSEGAVVIDAYNALGYTAAAIGNHDFEFGAVDANRFEPGADRRGALKARAAQARFAMLAANLLEHDQPVAWPNVRPSVVVEAAGVPVGVIGVMTHDALSMTLASNVTGLRVTPLAPAIAAEATRLRADGVAVVVVAAHAGGYCTAFADPRDLASCDDTAEIFDVARALPAGLVDVIFAGHTHAAVAHEVNGVAIVQAHAWGRSFSRVDVSVTPTSRGWGGAHLPTAVSTRILPPHDVCTWVDPQGRCAPDAAAGSPATYEGRPVVADEAIDAAMAPTLARVRELRATSLGATFETTMPRGSGTEESALANLFADAIREVAPGTDVAIGQASGPGGLRTDLPAGPATLGALYDTFPFDNLIVRRTLTGAELRRVITTQLRRPRWGGRAFGVSGMQVRLDCRAGGYEVDVARDSGAPIRDGDVLVVAMSDFLAARSGVIAPAAAAPHAAEPAVQMTDLVARWLRERGGRLSATQFADPARPRWTRTPAATAGCAADGQ
jgi:2',3'-cyclic-nucleotide 2'-phosphodiesterase (5'-nucleotidase family)